MPTSPGSTGSAPAGTPVPWAAPTATEPVAGEVRLPGSKSMTARALVLAANATGPSTLRAPLRARDTELMAAGLRAMGVAVDTTGDDAWRVLPGRLSGPAAVDVGLSGTVMRFLPALATLATGPIAFDGDPYARRRPLGPLVDALRALGASIDASGTGGLPLTVHGAGRLAGGEVTIDASASSQLVSALLLAGAGFDDGVVVRHHSERGSVVPSAPHLRMTVQMLREAGVRVDDAVADVWSVLPAAYPGRDWPIEPDLSGAAPFLAAAVATGGQVTIPGWPRETTQPGDRLRHLLAEMGATVSLTDRGLVVRGTGTVHGLDADLGEVSELTPVIAALAALADAPSRLRGIGHIRGHETDRIAALARELKRLGARVEQLPDGLAIDPAPLTGCRFDSYDDHRMVHAGAVIGLVVPGVTLTDVACTSKTMPGFVRLWSTLAGDVAETAAETAADATGGGR